MTLSVAIMAHPKRAQMVDQLIGQIGDIPIAWDEHNDRYDTGSRALELYDPAATHHLVLQDDVVPCRDLIRGAEAAVEHLPAGCPASLYLGRVRPFAKEVAAAVAHAGSSSWLTMEGIYWGPAIIVPTEGLDKVIAKFRQSKRKNYDRRLSAIICRHGVRCWYTWPSLVDHRGIESLSHDTKAKRTAHRFIGARSALSVDWSGQVVHMSNTGELDMERQRRAK